MIKIVLCDDEVRFLEIEKKLIAEYFEDKGMTFSVESYSSGEELLKDEAMLKTADLIILDVEMKGIDGISTAKKIRENNDKVNIAFLSAHMNYSTDGYHVRALRFMLKTTDDLKEYMHECLDRVLESIDLIDREVTLDFTIGRRSVRIADISYLKSSGNYTSFYTAESTKETYLLRSPLRKVTDMLEAFDFVSVSAKETVNLYHVSDVSRYRITLDNGVEIPVSQKKYNEVCREYTLYRGKNV